MDSGGLGGFDVVVAVDEVDTECERVYAYLITLYFKSCTTICSVIFRSADIQTSQIN